MSSPACPSEADRALEGPGLAGVEDGLDADSAADYLQVRSVSVERLVQRIGSLDAELVEEIVAGIVIALDYQP